MVETVATRTGLIWALKSSFVAYVASLPDGTVTAEGGATAREGAFHFPMAGLEGDPGSGAAGTLRFKGAVGFSGHHGMLRLALKDPLIVLGPDVCSLCAEVRGQQREIAQLPSRPPIKARESPRVGGLDAVADTPGLAGVRRRVPCGRGPLPAIRARTGGRLIPLRGLLHG